MVAFDSTRSDNPVVDAKGVAAEMMGFKSPKQQARMQQQAEEQGMVQPVPEVGYWSNALFKGLEASPPLTPSVGYSIFRGQNTILGGGATGKTGWLANMNPRTMGRFSSQEIFREAPSVKGKGLPARRAAYSPFSIGDTVNDLGTSLMKRTAKHADLGDETAKTVGGYAKKYERRFVQGAVNRLSKRGIVEPGAESQKIMQRGMMSHISAGMKVANQETITAKQAMNMNKALKVVNPASTTELVAGQGGREAAMQYMAKSASGTVSARVSGYTAGAAFGREAAEQGGTAVFNSAATKAVEHMAIGGIEKQAGKMVLKETGEKVGMKVAGSVLKKAAVEQGAGAAAKLGVSMGAAAGASWIPVVNVAMAAWMIYDLAKLGATLAKEMVIKPAVKFGREAVRSYKGQIDKSPFGVGFKDNSVLMTARQRGVMAISNSRLNARSVLGNEASSIHAHFG